MQKKENNEKDIALIRDWQSGNTEALEKILIKYMPLILKASTEYYKVGNWEDMRQELILIFMEHAKRFDTEKQISFASYIKHKIYWARNDILRKTQRQESHEALTLDNQEEPSYEPDWDAVDTCYLRNIIITLPLTLKQKQLLLLYTEGKTVPQIQTITGMKQQSISRMKKSIQKRLQGQENYLRTLCSNIYYSSLQS